MVSCGKVAYIIHRHVREERDAVADHLITILPWNMRRKVYDLIAIVQRLSYRMDEYLPDNRCSIRHHRSLDIRIAKERAIQQAWCWTDEIHLQ